MKKRGRPAHEPSKKQRHQVEFMAAIGISERDIARVVGINVDTLQRYYRDELDLGHVRASTKVAANLFRLATGDGPAAATSAIFWMKTRMRWKQEHSDDRTAQEIAQDGGGKAARAAIEELFSLFYRRYGASIGVPAVPPRDVIGFNGKAGEPS